MIQYFHTSITYRAMYSPRRPNYLTNSTQLDFDNLSFLHHTISSPNSFSQHGCPLIALRYPSRISTNSDNLSNRYDQMKKQTDCQSYEVSFLMLVSYLNVHQMDNNRGPMNQHRGNDEHLISSLNFLPFSEPILKCFDP